MTQSDAGKVFGFNKNSMSMYVRAYHAEGEKSFSYKKRGCKEGTHCFLTPEHKNSLISTITNTTPDVLGMDYTLWNSKVIKAYIETKYSIVYSDRGIRGLMQNLGFSSQKPIKLAYQRNPKKISEWLEQTYPGLKTKAMKEGARIYWGDEMGIHSSDNNGKTYGVIGKTPAVKKTGSRFKCNMLAAISPQGFMNWMVFKENFTSKLFIEFLRRMIRQIKQKIFMIVDNHKAHHSKDVKAFIEKHKDKIELFFLPPYCPDMNPQELVNQDVKANAYNFKALTCIENLMINVRSYLSKIQFNEFKIMKYFNKDEVKYAAWYS